MPDQGNQEKTMSDMNTTNLNVVIEESIGSSPVYDPKKIPKLRIEKAVIVPEGMKNGEPSVDLQLVDKHGNEYVVFASGGILTMLGQAIKGVSQREKVYNDGMK